MALIEIENVHAGYGGTEVLHGVGIRVDTREMVTVIGPNGAGKSTLLKAMMGYLIPTAGRICFEGGDITRSRPDERVRIGIGYVPQLENVFPSLTVEENLKMGAYTVPRETLAERTERAYAWFPRLADRRKQRVRTMSGGERQMLAMARALMTEPRVLLLDEPSAALSPQMAEEVFEKITEINAEGRAVVIVEQDAERALAISDRGYVLVNGRNAYEDSAGGVLGNETIREAYLGPARPARHCR